MGQTLEAVPATDRDWTLQALDSNGVPVATLSATDTYSAVLWAGEDQPTIFSPTVTLVDAGSGRWKLSIVASQTANLTPGTYRLQAFVQRPSTGRKATLFDGRLRLLPTPAFAAAVPVYGTAQQMLSYAPWLETLQSDLDEAGFLLERGRARTWFDGAILTRWKGANLFPQLGGPQYAPWAWGLGLNDPYESVWLKQQLALNQGVGGSPTLMVDDKIIEIVSKKAIGYVCEAQVGKDPEGPYQALAARYHRDASGLAKTCRAMLDINADGYPELVINLGATNLR